MQIIDDRLPPPLSLSLLPCCGVEHRGELSAAAWRANDTRLYISIDTREIRLASIHDPLILHNSAPSAYLPSFSLYLLSSIFISLFIARNVSASTSFQARIFEKREKSRGSKERACRGRREDQSGESGVALRAVQHLSIHLLFPSLSVSLSLFRAVFYRFEIRSL